MPSVLDLESAIRERAPLFDDRARGAFAGLTLAHGRGHLLRAVLVRASTLNPLHDPLTTYHLLDAGMHAITVDDRLSNDDLRTLAVSMTGLRTGAISFMTAPVRGLGQQDGHDQNGKRTVEVTDGTGIHTKLLLF